MDQRQASLDLSVPVSEILDPDLWLQRYAWFIVDSMRYAWHKAGARGIFEAIPKDTIRWHLKCALSEVEKHLGIPMGIRVVKSLPVDSGLVLGRDYDQARPRMPYMPSEAQAAWCMMNLPAGVISVERVRAYILDTVVWSQSAPSDSIHLQWPEQGVVRLMPVSAVSLVLGGDAMISLYSTLYGYGRVIPDVWAVDYTLGPTDQMGQPGRLEAVIAHWCACKAGVTLLNQAGAAISKGLSSSSLGFDGFSRSVSWQASAMYGVNSATEHVYDEACKSIDWKKMKLAKKGIRCLAYGS